MTDTTNVSDASGVPLPTVKYAGFWVRYVAYVVDALIIFIPVFIVNLIVGIVFIVTFGEKTVGGPMVGLIEDIINILIVWIYFTCMTYKFGATLGKMLVGVRVESETFQKLSFGKILLRESVGKFVSGLILCVGYIMAGFTPKKQALHDTFAKSVVVYKNPAKPHGPGLVVGIIIASLIPLAFVFFTLSAIVLVSLNDARQDGQNAQMQQNQPTIPSQYNY